MFICYNRDSAIVIIIALINKARAFCNCVAMCYCRYCEVRLLLLIVVILLLLSPENRASEFKVSLPSWLSNNNNINTITIINKCYVFLHVYYPICIPCYRNNASASCASPHSEAHTSVEVTVERGYNHSAWSTSPHNKHPEEHLSLLNWLRGSTEFVKSMLTMLIMNPTTPRRRRGPSGRFLRKLRANNARTFGL